jgi:hypothetical protein
MSLNTLPPPVRDKFWIDDTNSFGINSLNAINSPGSLTIQPLDTIQGKMITATLHFDEMQMPVQDDIDIKNKLLNVLAIELLSAKCIEFTKQQDIATNTTVVRARIFATPDTQVRIIREATK